MSTPPVNHLRSHAGHRLGQRVPPDHGTARVRFASGCTTPRASSGRGRGTERPARPGGIRRHRVGHGCDVGCLSEIVTKGWEPTDLCCPWLGHRQALRPRLDRADAEPPTGQQGSHPPGPYSGLPSAWLPPSGRPPRAPDRVLWHAPARQRDGTGRAPAHLAMEGRSERSGTTLQWSCRRFNARDPSRRSRWLVPACKSGKRHPARDDE